MFQLLKNPDYDFMGRRHVFMGISTIVVLTSIVLLATRGINRGIEFTGGSELQVRFTEAPDLGRIRSTLTQINQATPVVTTIGDPANYEVYIKLGSNEAAGEEDDTIQRALNALRAAFGVPTTAAADGDKPLDLNIADQKTIADRLATSPDITTAEARTLAQAILAQRKEIAIFRSLDELWDIQGMSPAARAVLEQQTLGPFALRSQSYIGPVIGKELLRKALLAILGSLVGMLLYIWIRFQLQWGFAAVAALTHDTLVTLGLFSLLGKEMSLPVVAAFLTLVGYSVNDTVVVFDRIRENIRNLGVRDLAVVVNKSINQTLSRTIITTGSTWLVVFGLFLFGGEALSAFSFVLTVGILVGTYSSIFVASPIVVLTRAIAQRRAATT